MDAARDNRRGHRNATTERLLVRFFPTPTRAAPCQVRAFRQHKLRLFTTAGSRGRTSAGRASACNLKASSDRNSPSISLSSARAAAPTPHDPREIIASPWGASVVSSFG